MQHMGVPKAAINCLFTTLQEASHQVCTGCGVSTSSYSGALWLLPLHGIGQGNGTGPDIWAVVSTPLLNLLCSASYGCTIILPILKESFKVVGYAFVDDTNIIQSMPTLDTSTSLQELQKATDLWEQGL